MSDRHRVLWVPKRASTVDEYEDAHANSATPDGGMFAVADGAAEASYSREWALALVGAYVGGAATEQVLQWDLPELQAAWRDRHPIDQAPYWAAEKLALGSHAALLGVRLFRRASLPRIHVLAAGDCNLAHVRASRLHCSFPITDSASFGTHPSLLSTSMPAAAQVRLMSYTEEWVETGDLLFLMTDALAAWFLRSAEAGGTPWEELLELPDENEEFGRWVASKRGPEMRNDDVTLILVEVE